MKLFAVTIALVSAQDYLPIGMTNAQINLLKKNLAQGYNLMISSWAYPIYQEEGFKGSLAVTAKFNQRVDSFSQQMSEWAKAFDAYQLTLKQLAVNNIINKAMMDQLEQTLKSQSAICEKAKSSLAELKANYIIEIAQAVQATRQDYMVKFQVLDVQDSKYYNPDEIQPKQENGDQNWYNSQVRLSTPNYGYNTGYAQPPVISQPAFQQQTVYNLKPQNGQNYNNPNNVNYQPMYNQGYYPNYRRN